MPPVGFEPTISAGERPQTYALDRAATGTTVHITAVKIASEIIRLCVGFFLYSTGFVIVVPVGEKNMGERR